MKKLLITACICVSANVAASYAQKQHSNITEEAPISVDEGKGGQYLEQKKTIKATSLSTENTKIKASNTSTQVDGEVVNENEQADRPILHTLVRNTDFYRLDKGQKGMFFVVQDFYASGEKRTDPYLITNLDNARLNDFSAVQYDHLGVNGLLILWFRNGQVEQKGVFGQEGRKGLWVSWYENGQKKTSGHYRKGLKEGQWTVWYQNGRRMQKGHYHIDKREGVWIYWYGNGKKKEAGRYQGDQKVERWSYWDDTGKFIKSEVKEDIEPAVETDK